MSNSNASRPTPGPWVVDEDDARDGCWFVPVIADGHGNVCEVYGSEIFLSITDDDRANAALIAEAGTAYHDTGLTPRELAEQRAELLAALREGARVLGNMNYYRELPADDMAVLIKARAAIANAGAT